MNFFPYSTNQEKWMATLRPIACRRLAILLGLLLSIGCSPINYGDLGHVTGTVTLDGQPYPKAMVIFSPEAGGRPSKGITDEAGQYELIYIRTTRGAEPGQHAVSITTVPPSDNDPDFEKSKLAKEVIPTRYNSQSQLRQKVEAGANTIDFELNSK